MKRIILVGLGLVSILIGFGFILPAMAKLHSYRLNFIEQPLWLGILLTCGGVGISTCGFNKRARPKM